MTRTPLQQSMRQAFDHLRQAEVVMQHARESLPFGHLDRRAITYALTLLSRVSAEALARMAQGDKQ